MRERNAPRNDNLAPAFTFFAGVSIFLAAVLCAGVIFAHAEPQGKALVSAESSVDKKEAFIGDKILYEVTVTAPKDAEITFPQFAENLGGFAIKDFGGSKKSRPFKGVVVYRQWYLLDTYVTGEYKIPGTEIAYKTKDGKEGRVAVKEAAVMIKSILEAEGKMPQDIRDIKKPFEFPGNLKFWILTALAVAVAITAAFVFYSVKKSRVFRILPARPAHEAAYEALEALRNEGLAKSGQVKEYYFRLSSIVRQYLESRFNLRAPEMTTEEFLGGLRDSDKLDEGLKVLLRNFLFEADMVKFAKYGPSEKEIDTAFEAAKNLVDRTKDEGRGTKDEGR